MKEKIKSLVILILLVLTIYLCFRIWQGPGNTSLTTSNSGKPDTVYLPIQAYSEEDAYDDDDIPEEIRIYIPGNSGTFKELEEKYYQSRKTSKGPKSRNGQDRINTLSPDTTKQFQDFGPLLYDSISQILLKNDWLELTTKNTLDSTYKIRKFKIDPVKYNYNWVNNKLTYKKRINLQLVPYIKGSYRPFNKFTDLNAGISLETGKFNYNLGFNLFYYPNLSDEIGKDLEISITYKFK